MQVRFNCYRSPHFCFKRTLKQSIRNQWTLQAIGNYFELLGDLNSRHKFFYETLRGNVVECLWSQKFGSDINYSGSLDVVFTMNLKFVEKLCKPAIN